ncbi:MAG: bifunctional histidinol-phosphatase/imidazoleglycerol-phosphate dehydratase HisB [Pseudomonadota bacterium]
MNARKILFVDRDGTLIAEPADEQVDSIAKIRLVEDVIPALRTLLDAGYELVMVTNQDGLGTPSFPESDFQPPHDFMVALFASQGIRFAETFVCPHLPSDQCACRKPSAGLLTKFLAANTIDVEASAVVGDRQTDLGLAENLGLRGFLLGEDCSWNEIARTLVTRPRSAQVTRTTSETSIDVTITLDSEAPSRISTGIGFLDHMLEQIARHARLQMLLDCQGDLHIDDHHTIEDIALSIGAAMRQALGDKRGIGRYGFLMPMDESLAQVAIDLSGRPASRLDVDFKRETVGGLATEMVRHFFESLAQSLGAAIHIEAKGENAHHIVEACFKGVGRALRPALAKSGNDIPSTKGLL